MDQSNFSIVKSLVRLSSGKAFTVYDSKWSNQLTYILFSTLYANYSLYSDSDNQLNNSSLFRLLGA
jgi:hypothetical protein